MSHSIFGNSISTPSVNSQLYLFFAVHFCHYLLLYICLGANCSLLNDMASIFYVACSLLRMLFELLATGAPHWLRQVLWTTSGALDWRQTILMPDNAICGRVQTYLDEHLRKYGRTLYGCRTMALYQLINYRYQMKPIHHLRIDCPSKTKLICLSLNVCV